LSLKNAKIEKIAFLIYYPKYNKQYRVNISNKNLLRKFQSTLKTCRPASPGVPATDIYAISVFSGNKEYTFMLNMKYWTDGVKEPRYSYVNLISNYELSSDKLKDLSEPSDISSRYYCDELFYFVRKEIDPLIQKKPEKFKFELR